VTGFAGGERGPFGSYYLVRGLDAHAWVEAWCGPGHGWIAFDPTPAAGRPGVTKVSILRSAGQLFENLEFLYGRYVLGFAQADQASLAQTVREGFEAASETARRIVRAIRALAGRSWRHPALLLLGLAAAVTAAFLFRRLPWAGSGFGTRGLPPASAAYRKLQRVLRRQGADLTPASAPSETLASAEALGAGRISREIVGAYVAESFGGRLTPEAEATRLDGLLRALRARRPSGCVVGDVVPGVKSCIVENNTRFHAWHRRSLYRAVTAVPPRRMTRAKSWNDVPSGAFSSEKNVTWTSRPISGLPVRLLTMS
jgi:hypothetical protein